MVRDPIYYDSLEGRSDGDDARLNGQVAMRGERFGSAVMWLESLPEVSVCPYCKTRLERAYHYSDFQDYIVDDALALDCPSCGFWVFKAYEQVDETLYGVPIHSWAGYVSKLNEFTEELPEECYSELVQHIRRNPGLWHTMEPSRLERLVAEICRRNYAPCEAIHVGRPGDGGVDVLLLDSDRGKCLMQVKRRETPTSSEGVGTIRNILGAMVLEDVLQGIVVSTADHFTYQANKARGVAEQVGYYLGLIDRGKLNRMLDPLLPDRPWLKLVSKHFPDWTPYFGEAIPSRRQRHLF